MTSKNDVLILTGLDMRYEYDRILWARECGAKNFTATDLLNGGLPKSCPYETELYREAWCHGWYAEATFWLLRQMAKLYHTTKPDIGKMLVESAKNNPNWEVAL